MDWWNYLASIPAPRIIVLAGRRPPAGLGALVGEIHATIAQALNCAGCVTNGAVRDLRPSKRFSFPLFSGAFR